MIYLLAENRQHADTWARLQDVNPRKVVLVDRPEQFHGMRDTVMLLYHTFWRRPDSLMLYDCANAHGVVIVNVPDKSSHD